MFKNILVPFVFALAVAHTACADPGDTCSGSGPIEISSSCSKYNCFDGAHINGYDISCVVGVSEAECAEKCCSQADCKGFDFSASDHGMGAGRCCTGYVSRVEGGFEHNGGTYRSCEKNSVTCAAQELFVVRPAPLELSPRHRPPPTPPASPARPHSPFSPLSCLHPGRRLSLGLHRTQVSSASMTYDEGVAHCAASGSTLAAIYDTSELATARAAISAAGVEKAITSASSDGSGWAWHGTERWEEGGFPLNTGQVTDQREGAAGHIYSLHRSESDFVWDADGRGERHPVLCRLPTWNQAHEQCNAAHATGIDATCCIGSDIAQQCECASSGRRRELSPFHEDTRGRELGHCCDYGAYCDCSTLAHAKPNPPSPVAETSLLANLCLLVSHSAGGTAQRLLS